MNMLDKNTHPCFNEEARHKFARVHLPVAPACNIQCAYCNRKYACVNENRPGVTCSNLSPQQALVYLERLMEKLPNISVVGIAGPGDAFANAEQTLETLRLVKQKYPHLLFCVATNGFGVLPYIDEFKDLGLTHVTVTINSLRPETAEKIYLWARDGNKLLRGRDAAEELIKRQLEAVKRIADLGITVKINSVVIPGVNDMEMEEIARETSRLGAQLHNCISIYPVADTPYEDAKPATCDELNAIRERCSKYLEQMKHCQRCRADAAGLLGKEDYDEISAMVKECASLPLFAQDDRPYTAVASAAGTRVDQHLGKAPFALIFERNDNRFKVVDVRRMPPEGGGNDRWAEVAKLLSDCHSFVVSCSGERPKQYLLKTGLKVIDIEADIATALRVACGIEELTEEPGPCEKGSCAPGCVCG